MEILSFWMWSVQLRLRRLLSLIAWIDVQSVLAHLSHHLDIAALNVRLQVSFLYRTFANLPQKNQKRGPAPISIVVLGDSGVGKSAITFRFVTGEYPEEVRCFQMFLGLLLY